MPEISTLRNEPSGILLIDKPEGVTSHDMVGLTRRLFSTRKVGHAGTLDPMATGVLIVLIGQATKLSELLLEKEKTYEATLRLGITTDTQDVTGEVLSESVERPSEAALRSVCADFTGDLMQVPPMYSALKQNGQKLYDLARRGIEVERAARPVTIHALDLLSYDGNDAELRVTCSKGTYIRTLCHDIGASLGCGGTMATLRRTVCGPFTLAQAITPDKLSAMTYDERIANLLPVEDALSAHPIVHLPAFFAKLAHSGLEIYQKKISTDYPIGTLVRLYDTNGFFALAEVRTFDDESALKPIRQF